MRPLDSKCQNGPREPGDQPGQISVKQRRNCAREAPFRGEPGRERGWGSWHGNAPACGERPTKTPPWRRSAPLGGHRGRTGPGPREMPAVGRCAWISPPGARAREVGTLGGGRGGGEDGTGAGARADGGWKEEEDAGPRADSATTGLRRRILVTHLFRGRLF